MYIGLDLDGVLYDWDQHARFSIARHRNPELKWFAARQGFVTTVTVEADRYSSPSFLLPSTYWDHLKQTVPRAEWDWLNNEAIDEGFFREPGWAYPGARESVDRLSEIGKVVIITRRPQKASKDTEKWLEGWPIEGIFHIADGQLKASVVCAIYLDDNPEEVRRYLEAGLKAYLLARPWNETSGLAHWVESLEMFESKVRDFASQYTREWRRSGGTLKDSGSRREFQTGAQRDRGGSKGAFHLLPAYGLLAAALQFERGMQKYGERNWEKGMPLSEFYNSGMRHLVKFGGGADDEPHLGAAIWNLLCLAEGSKRIEMGLWPAEYDDIPKTYRGQELGF